MDRFFLRVQHRMNPLHLYCRLRERGMNPKASLTIARLYERYLFRPLIFPICRG